MCLVETERTVKEVWSCVKKCLRSDLLTRFISKRSFNNFCGLLDKELKQGVVLPLNKITREQVAEKMEISKAEAEDILFCHIEEFTLDRLITYASKLLEPAEVNIALEQKGQKKPSLHA
jgi:predicted XRE-type DNA-binding protein